MLLVVVCVVGTGASKSILSNTELILLVFLLLAAAEGALLEVVEVKLSGSGMASKTEVCVLVDWALYVLSRGSDRERRLVESVAG